MYSMVDEDNLCNFHQPYVCMRRREKKERKTQNLPSAYLIYLNRSYIECFLIILYQLHQFVNVCFYVFLFQHPSRCWWWTLRHPTSPPSTRVATERSRRRSFTHRPHPPMSVAACSTGHRPDRRPKSTSRAVASAARSCSDTTATRTR